MDMISLAAAARQVETAFGEPWGCDQTDVVRHPASRARAGSRRRLAAADRSRNVCEITESFGNHQIPPLASADLVAIEHAGAYAASFTSRYHDSLHLGGAVVAPQRA
jgi:hypothetical protein